MQRPAPSALSRSSPAPLPHKKKNYWLGEKIYKRMENGGSESEGSEDVSPTSSKKTQRKKALRKPTPEHDQVSSPYRFKAEQRRPWTHAQPASHTSRTSTRITT